MAALGETHRTYALDFWGFGESGKRRATYAVQDFVSLVTQFMDRLGIDSAPLVGHSMGGTVSLLVGVHSPERVKKIVVIGSPISGSSLALPLKLAGRRGIAVMLFTMMGAFRRVLRVVSPLICRDPRFPGMMDKDLSRTTLESFLLSIASLRHTDLIPHLGSIKVPTLGMYGDRDKIVHPKQWIPLQEGIPHAVVERFPSSGHFIMLDDPYQFLFRLRTFLDTKEDGR